MYSNRDFSNHENTYEIIRRINKQLHNISEKRVFRTASSHGNVFLRLALSLYKHRGLVILCSFAVSALLPFTTHFVNTSSFNLFIDRSLFDLVRDLILVIYSYSMLAGNFTFMIAESRFGMSRKEKDFRIAQGYLQQTGLSLREAKINIREEFKKYDRKKVAVGFIITSLLLSFSISVLSSADFQSAVFSFSLKKMYELNNLGTICICLMIPMSIYFCFVYLAPTNLLGGVLDVMNNEFEE